jgi:hypothetical protein
VVKVNKNCKNNKNNQNKICSKERNQKFLWQRERVNLKPYCKKHKPGQKFYAKITGRYGVMAFTAASTQSKPA